MTMRTPGGTRERILAAAAAILAEEGAAARLSVRAVAGRAGVSIGSMRHHFPTQQHLRDEVLMRIGDWMAPSELMLDTSLPGHTRLVRSLLHILAQAGAGQAARDALITTVNTFVDVEQTPAMREAYLAIHDDGQRRIESWLRVLADEGLVARPTVDQHARFLATVLDGLALQRALPAHDSLARVETETLEWAVSTIVQ